MDNTPRTSLHPIHALTGIAVTIFALVGTAHFLGWLPSKTDSTPPATATVPAPEASSSQTSANPPTPVLPGPTGTAPQSLPAKPKPAHKPPIPTSPPQSTATMPSTPAVIPPPPPAGIAAPCRDCGTIESVRQITREGEGSGLGAVAGGVIGGALGQGVGQGTGRDLATIAGAIGGAVLGNKIEKSQKTAAYWQINVRFDDGTSRLINSDSPPAWRPGDKVRVVNGTLSPR